MQTTMRTHLLSHALLTGLLVLLAGLVAGHSAGAQERAAQRVTEAEAIRVGWPSLAGPRGNFMPLYTDVPLLEDLSRARILWISEDRDLGAAKKGGVPTSDSYSGNWGSLIVADGRVFGASMRPTGPMFDFVDGRGTTNRVQIDAEDVVLALDFHTGKTLWKDVIPGSMSIMGGKRAGFQVTAVYANGKVFSLGNTGRLMAHDAATGKRLWMTPADPVRSQKSDEVLAAAAAGKPAPDWGPGWRGSLLVADGVLVAGSRGYDVETGALKWESKMELSRFATPSVWRHQGREYILCAHSTMRLIDPGNGQTLWTVEGLGPMDTTLAPSGDHVLVNVRVPGKGREKAHGLFGCYELSLTGAKLLWQCPDEAEYRFPTWQDNSAMVRHFIQDGKAWFTTANDGTTFNVLDLNTGALVARWVDPEGKGPSPIVGLFYLLDPTTIICRSNSSHGPRHGGRHPWVLWRQQGAEFVRLDDQGRLAGMDLADFTTAYEILMETPVVAGRLFERLQDGRVACYDLRAHRGETTWQLSLEGGYVGLEKHPLETVLYVGADGTIRNGKAWPPLPEQAGMVWAAVRRFPMWQAFATRDFKLAGDKATGTALIDFGSNIWPFELAISRNGNQLSGTWTRRVPALAKTVATKGTVQGQPPTKDLGVPTPWLKESPWTKLAANPPGTLTYVFRLQDAVSVQENRAASLDVSLDHDGTRFTRGAACAYRYNQVWHEIDPRGLQLKAGKITGTAAVLLAGDSYVYPNETLRTGAAGKITLDVTIGTEGITGSYQAVWGEAVEITGTLSGRVGP